MDNEQVQFWSMIGGWVSGLGSLAAVLVALYLARREGRLRLIVEVDIHPKPKLSELIYTSKVELTFKITNVGLLPAEIVYVGWRYGFFRPKRLQISEFRIPRLARTSEEERVLARGQFLDLNIFGGDFQSDWNSDLRHFLKSSLNLLFLVMEVHTSVHQVVTVRPSIALLNYTRSKMALVRSLREARPPGPSRI